MVVFRFLQIEQHARTGPHHRRPGDPSHAGMQQRGGLEVEPLGVAAAWIDSAAWRRGVLDTFTKANGRERRRYLKQHEYGAASIAAFRTRSRERLGTRSVA